MQGLCKDSFCYSTPHTHTMNSIILNGLEVADFLREIREIVHEEVLANMVSKEAKNEDWMDLDETAAFLKKAKQTVYGYTSNSSIPHYRRGGKLYFLKSEIETWLLNGKRG
jgi:predicted DNA-binding transcriptional regulator AlpA